MKLPKILQRKNVKLQATARRMPRESAEMDEPNMKLSSAFVVVLVLHVVAVGGIYAFNSIKAHRAPVVDAAYKPTIKTTSVANGGDEAGGPDLVTAATTGTRATVAAPASSRIHRVKAGETIARIAADNHVTVDDIEEANSLKNASAIQIGQELKIPVASVEPAKPAEKRPLGTAPKGTAMIRDSGETYTVAKGDNPVSIARKFSVSYDELLKLNKIEDPRKLRIGTKLRLPGKPKHNP
jgi:LysM repeat protein